MSLRRGWWRHSSIEPFVSFQGLLIRDVYPIIIGSLRGQHCPGQPLPRNYELAITLSTWHARAATVAPPYLPPAVPRPTSGAARGLLGTRLV